MRVLIADDSLTSRTMLKRALVSWGYEVTSVENGTEAWDVLSQPDAPSLAILDWVMPGGLTGPEVCQKVREQRREPYTYIILLTSKGTKIETVEGLAAGADDYVVKPFDNHELQVRLRAGKRIIDLQLELLEAREELRDRANKDQLTMLPNRSAIHSTLEGELARCHRDGRTVGVILLDIDKFKSINDTYGHFAGDLVLKETAARLKANIRPYDQVGRYGGEEFLVVLPNCDLEQATMQAERLRSRLAAVTMNVDGVDLLVTASFGVTMSDATLRNSEMLVRVADEALYRSKAEGRNRVSSLMMEDSNFGFVKN